MEYDFLTQESNNLLKLIYKKGYKKISSYSVEKARELFSDSHHKLPNQITLPILRSWMIANLFMPKSRNSNTLIVFLHGGGYVFRNLTASAKLCKKLCNKTNSYVLLLHYSLAPEFKFPYATQQVTDLLNKLASKKIKIANQSFSHIYLCGESSGANLAASTAINTSMGIKTGLILLCPSLDYSNNYISKEKYATGLLLDKNVRDWLSSHYLSDEEERNNPLVSPARSKDYSKFSNSLMICAKYDPLYSEAHSFYSKAKQHVDITCFEYPTIHGFMTLDIKPYSSDAIDKVKQFLNLSR